MFPESALVPSEMEQIKLSKRHLIHLVGYFDDYYHILELFPPFLEKEILA